MSVILEMVDVLRRALIHPWDLTLARVDLDLFSMLIIIIVMVC